MNQLRSNINEFIVKLFYASFIILFLTAFINNLLGTYDVNHYQGYFVFINFSAIYTIIYSLYFRIKYREEHRNLKLRLLKRIRKISLFAGVFVMISIYYTPPTAAMQTVFYLVFWAGLLGIIVTIVDHMRRIKKHFNTYVIWMD